MRRWAIVLVVLVVPLAGCGLAPGQVVWIVIVGIWTSGVNCMGIRIRAITPNSATSKTPTETLTGLRRKAWMGCMAEWVA